MNSLKSLKAYTSVDRHSSAEADDTHAMITALFDELLRRMRNFSQNIGGNDEELQLRNESYAKSLAILHALQSCLDFDKGGEIAENLFRLYEFARQQLLASFRTGEVERVDAAIHSLSEIRDAWNSMDRAADK
jgi:flagellar protein FliS